jgi:hypothetical protein
VSVLSHCTYFVTCLFIFPLSPIRTHDECTLNVLLHTSTQMTGKASCYILPHLNVIFNISNIFNGANARIRCSISNCDTLRKVLGAGIICKYFYNTVQKCCSIDYATVYYVNILNSILKKNCVRYNSVIGAHI